MGPASPHETSLKEEPALRSELLNLSQRIVVSRRALLPSGTEESHPEDRSQ